MPLIIVFSIILVIIIVNRKALTLKFNTIFKKEIIENENNLKVMNNDPLPVFTDINNNKGNSPIKILIIGNSITRHAIATQIGWNHESGMAASSEDKDYVHLLLNKIENKFPDKSFHLRISNLSKFERNLSSFKKEEIDSLINFNSDFVIFQLGENVDVNTPKEEKIFLEKYTEFINYFKKNNSVTICTTPFFTSPKKNKIIDNVALSTTTSVVDLSHLTTLDPENYSKNDTKYGGNRTLWKADGIGIHPGDKGMENIAQQIFLTLSTLIEANQTKH